MVHDHNAKYIHLICTDPRIQKLYHEFLAANNLWGNFDTIAYENPTLDFFDERKKDAMIGRIKTYVQLHGPDTLVIFDHLDCGAYRLAGYKFQNREDELNTHRANNKKIIGIMGRELPEISIAVKYIKIDEDGACAWITENE